VCSFINILAAIERENDELLALLDVQERARYEESRSNQSQENYHSFTSSEVSQDKCQVVILEADVAAE